MNTLLQKIMDLFADYNQSAVARAKDISQVLFKLDIDAECQVAGFLYGLGELDETNLSLVESEIGDSVVNLYKKSLKVQQLSSIQQISPAQKSAPHFEENLRKMLIAMVDDVRVVLIVLAGHLQLLRESISTDEDRKRELAVSAREVFAPLANRLGIWQLKWEIEDISFRYLHPNSYKTLARALEEKRAAREKYISDMVTDLELELIKQGIPSQVQGRAKHIYSIWKKMQRKGLEFKELWDLRAVRIVVDSVDQCYQVLSYVHSQWEHYPNEFVDYIATPKDNGYSSIHTVIKGPDSKSVEIQIRTAEMHKESELGLAAHWRYKESISGETASDNKVIWLRQLLEWKNQIIDENGSDIFSDGNGHQETRVYVFTPKGTVVDLPIGSTPVDFAYSIHTEVGHRTRGALVNGKMVPLHYQLKIGDQVHIQTIKSGGPSLDWLKSHPLYAVTHRARNRISQWHKHKEYDHYITEGRMLLDREINRLGLDDLSYEKINQYTHFHKVDDLFAAIGSQDYKVSKALYPFKRSLSTKKTDEESIALFRDQEKVSNKSVNKSGGAFTVQGVGNLLTHLANCCNPVPGDEIVGYITLGKGVSIHRRKCINIKKIDDQHKERIIDVDWGTDAETSYTMNIVVTGFHRTGLLHDITTSLKSSRADILKANMETDAEHVTRIQLRIEAHSTIRADALIRKLASVQNVFEVKREG